MEEGESEIHETLERLERVRLVGQPTEFARFLLSISLVALTVPHSCSRRFLPLSVHFHVSASMQVHWSV